MDVTFQISTEKQLNINNSEITDLLSAVYVDGGYTDTKSAAHLFKANSVRQRGTIIGAREKSNFNLAGFIILVPAKSPACRFAKDNEGEIQLLGVLPKYRKCGLGSALVRYAVQSAINNGLTKLTLWTQPAMLTAQSLYKSVGFEHIKNYQHNGVEFLLFELKL